MPPDPTAPVPVSGTFNVGVGDLLLTFDKPLDPGALFDPNWSLRATAHEYDTDEVSVEAGTPLILRGSFTQTDPAPPLDAVTYTAGLPDVIGQNGIPVAAFADFPVTLI